MLWLHRVNWPLLGVIIAFHLLALLTCIPWLFSWSGLAWAVVGLYVFGTLGNEILKRAKDSGHGSLLTINHSEPRIAARYGASQRETAGGVLPLIYVLCTLLI